MAMRSQIFLISSLAIGNLAHGATVLSADFDGDCKLDSARAIGGSIELRIGAHTRLLPIAARDLAAADIDCDGRLDLVIDHGARIIRNAALIAPADPPPPGGISGASPFIPVWDSNATYVENTTRHLVADLDGDGRNELITADYNGPNGADVATLRMFENNADNTWTEE